MSTEADETKADCYSAGERRWMEYGQRLRGKFLDPLLSKMTVCKIVPDHVTLASVIFGLLFVPMWMTGHPWWAILAVLLHVLLDGLDGPLARYQQTDSQQGSFTDSFCDQIIVSAVTITLMSGTEPLIGIWAGSLFMVLYVGVLAISMVRNALRTPYSWLVRPRFFLFAAIPIELWTIPNVVSAVVWVSNVLLALKVVSGFFRLRERLPGPKPHHHGP
jgi:phosphatidylglycerophosphate synthase